MADLELRNISKQFGSVFALKDVSLKVEDGEFAILLGPSGCGKSTLLRIIAGLETQTQGEVLIAGSRADDRSPRERDVAMVFQNYALYPHLTVLENLAFGLKMRKEKRQVIEERIHEAAQLLGISELLNRKPRELSGGQRQRVAMGRAIVRHPKLFLFDEPLSNLDARLRALMRVELKQLHQRLRVTMIYVTHDQVEAMTLGQKIVVMDRGKIQQVDTADRIYAAPENTFVAGFVGSPPMNLLEGSLQRQEGKWYLRSNDLKLELSDLREDLVPEHEQVVLGIRPEDVLMKRPSGSALVVDGSLEVVEDLGADRLIHVRRGHWSLVARAPRSEQYEPNHPMTIYLPVDRLHLFIQDRRVAAFH
jgi:ABC-type sugar transport system ATPase subunit